MGAEFDVTERERLDVTERERLDVTERERLAVTERERLHVTERERLHVTERERLHVTERERLHVTVRGRGRVRVVQPHGMLTERTGAELRRILTKVLLDHGRVVVDLDGLRVVRAACVTVFPAVLDHCGGWPRVRLVLCQPDQPMARALAQRRISALVPVCGLLPEAEDAIERRPAVVRARTRLVCNERAPDVARRLVRDTCPKWQVDGELQQIAELVVSELVDNAVRHARTAAALTLERGPRGLRIAVRDAASSNRSVPSGEPAKKARGRGLELVARLTTAWGVETHPVGKTVWAEIAGRTAP